MFIYHLSLVLTLGTESSRIGSCVFSDEGYYMLWSLGVWETGWKGGSISYGRSHLNWPTVTSRFLWEWKPCRCWDNDEHALLQEAGDNNQFCWRNLFSCINLLRLLNKLTKWKHSRTMVSGTSDHGVHLTEFSLSLVNMDFLLCL